MCHFYLTMPLFAETIKISKESKSGKVNFYFHPAQIFPIRIPPPAISLAFTFFPWPISDVRDHPVGGFVLQERRGLRRHPPTTMSSGLSGATTVEEMGAHDIAIADFEWALSEGINYNTNNKGYSNRESKA